MKCEVTLKYVNITDIMRGILGFKISDQTGAVKESVSHVILYCIKKYGGMVHITIQPPYKMRSTGPYSQNHHLNGHIIDICNATGNSYEDVKTAIKMFAVENMGYPYEMILGRIIPKHERDCNTEECAKLIEAAHIIAAEYGIPLKEAWNADR
jgi:hypothetical protein